MKGLLCADEMALAYHEGRKTQTRRVFRVDGVIPGKKYPVYAPEEKVRIA